MDWQSPLEQLPPGQLLLQYEEMDVHQLENWKQFKLSGKPAFRKQEAICIEQVEKAAKQELLSEKLGSGLEHHLPHLYSQVGVGEVVTLYLLDIF